MLLAVVWLAGGLRLWADAGQYRSGVQAEPSLSLHEAHILSGKVKRAIRSAVPSVQDVLVHMEPFEGL